jgi:pimeloyl-ACP methyl ester carboxylesterase
LSTQGVRWIDDTTFHNDVDYIESLWHQTPIHNLELPLIDIGHGEPLVFVPILAHLEFVYSRQIRTLSTSRRVILYRRQEMRTTPFGISDRVEELRQILDGLGLTRTDLIAHGDAAMVLFEFAIRYPQRCRSLIIIAQGADYHISPHPFIWWLHELFIRFPVEYVLSADFLRGMVINYITNSHPNNHTAPALSHHQIEEQFKKIHQWPFVYKCSILPIIHNFDIRKRLNTLTMPILLINRKDDALSPESKTRWLAQHLPNCAGYHIVSGKERFFMYSRDETVTPLIQAFLAARQTQQGSIKQLQQ